MDRLTQIKYYPKVLDLYKKNFKRENIVKLCNPIYPNRSQAYFAIDDFCKKHNVSNKCFYCSDVPTYNNEIVEYHIY